MVKRKTEQKKRVQLKTVELVRSTYQPTRAELAETEAMLPDVPEGTTLQQLARALLRPVNIRWIGKPRNRR